MNKSIKYILLCIMPWVAVSCVYSMEETNYMPKAYGDYAWHGYTDPIINPVIFKYDGYQREISEQVAHKFDTIKTILSPVWQKENVPTITWKPSPAYNHNHLSTLFALADNKNIALKLDDIMPLYAAADELQASHDIQENITEHSITVLNTTLASGTIARNQKEKAIGIYNSILADQDDDIIKQIAQRAEDEKALHGVYEIMYTSPLFQKALNKKKDHSLLQQWITNDPAKRFFDMCMKHKRSIKTMLEEHAIDPAQAYSIPYLAKVLNIKNKEIKDELKNIVNKFHDKQNFESMHDIYLLPYLFLEVRSHYITQHFTSQFVHIPLMIFFGTYGLTYITEHTLYFADIDWRILRDHNQSLELKHAEQKLHIIPQYENCFKIKRENDNFYIKPLVIKTDIVNKSQCVVNSSNCGIHIKDIVAVAGIVGLAYILYKAHRWFAMKEQVLAHTFIDTHITDNNRMQYQIAYDLYPSYFQAESKKILDNALPSPALKEVTILLPELKECHWLIDKLFDATNAAYSKCIITGVTGFVGVPAFELLAYTCSTGICNTIKKCGSWLYNKITRQNSASESINNTTTSSA